MFTKSRAIQTIFLLAITMLFLGCSTALLKKNRNNVKLLRQGMNKPEVLAVMGDPLTQEVYNTENVWYYFTDPLWSDGVITHDECTPLFFENDQLLGWGQEAYKQYRQEKW